MSIALITFDVFGTIVDWRRGLREALSGELSDEDFERVIDRQGELEQEAFRPYAEIVAQSLVDELGLEEAAAISIGAGVARWPLFPDSAQALQQLRLKAPCAAITNSDRAHRPPQLELDGWICAEDTHLYKPDVQMWRAASKALQVPFSRDWWHVSAYADYDLAAARSLGLTCVFVQRPHARPGQAEVTVRDLAELVART